MGGQHNQHYSDLIFAYLHIKRDRSEAGPGIHPMSAPLSALERLCTRGKQNVILLSRRGGLLHNALARLVSLIINFSSALPRFYLLFSHARIIGFFWFIL